MQGNFGALDGVLSSNDFDIVSNLAFQTRYFSGEGWAISNDGPWYTYRDLWDEDEPPQQGP